MEELNHELILGRDFLEFTKACVNFGDASVSLFDGLVIAKMLRDNDVGGYCMLNKRLCIAPRTECLTSILLSHWVPRNTTVLIEPLEESNNKFLTARVWATPRGRLCVGRIFNPSDKPLRLYKHAVVGTFEFLDESAVVESLDAENSDYSERY